jgi:hypothetical protein
MAHPPETRAGLRGAYIYQRLPLAEAADQYGVGHGVARAWKLAAFKAGDDWDAARAAVGLSREGQMAVATAVLEDFVMLFQAATRRLKDMQDLDPMAAVEVLARLSDSYTKMMSAAGKVATPISRLSVALETLRELAKYIGAERPDSLPVFAELLEGFGAKLTETYSRG